jgi:hypothetical protein
VKPESTPEMGDTRGAMMWRGVRYLAAVGAGYLFGLAAGSAAPDGPPFVFIALMGLVALWLIFRKGQQSNSHAAMDAVLSARAQAHATATATQQVNIAGGHIVGPHPLDGQRPPAVAARPPTYELPPDSAYDRIAWESDAEVAEVRYRDSGR